VRIGQLLTSVSRRNGGVAELARGLSRTLVELGGSVEVFGVQDADAAAELDSWRPLRPRLARGIGPALLAWAPGQASALRMAGLDVLHAHGLWTSQSLRTLGWADASGRPYLVSPHGMLEAWALRRSGFAKRFARWLFESRHLRRAACLHALSSRETRDIRSQGYTGPICEIPPGVELPLLGAVPAPPAWHAEIETGQRVLLYLGRLHPKKGLLRLIAGWAEARRRSPALVGGWRLLLAGWDQAGHEAQIRALASALGVADSVRLVGPAFAEERAAAYRAASAFVLPSQSEGVPLSVLEAWSYAVPVLMTDACNLPEGFEGEAALRLPPAPGALAGALLELLGLSDAERAAMGTRGRRLVERRFSWQVVGPRFLAVYTWLTAGGPAPEFVGSAR